MRSFKGKDHTYLEALSSSSSTYLYPSREVVFSMMITSAETREPGFRLARRSGLRGKERRAILDLPQMSHKPVYFCLALLPK